MKLPALVLLAAFAAGWPAAAGVRPRRNSPSGRSIRSSGAGGAVRSVVPLPHDRQRRPQRGARSHRERQRQLLLRTRRLHGDGRGGRTPFYRTVRRRQCLRYALHARHALFAQRRGRSGAGRYAHGLHDPPRELYGRCARYAHDRVPQLLDEGRLRTLARRPLSGGAASRLTERIKAKLREQYGAADDEELAQRGFFPETIAPTENFEVTPEGIVFHYNPYDIACYAIGEVDVPFTKEELK